MKLEMWKQVRDAIANEENYFSMEKFGMGPTAAEVVIGMDDTELSPDGMLPPPCGTASCICGWTNQIVGNKDKLGRIEYADERTAMTALGINDADAHRLFYAHWHPDHLSMNTISRAETIDYMDRCMEAGAVLEN